MTFQLTNLFQIFIFVNGEECKKVTVDAFPQVPIKLPLVAGCLMEKYLKTAIKGLELPRIMENIVMSAESLMKTKEQKLSFGESAVKTELEQSTIKLLEEIQEVSKEL